MKQWCIINLSDLEIIAHTGLNICRLDKKYGPTRFYLRKELAEDELLRLQQKFPRHEFMLFEAVGAATQSLVNKKLWTIEDLETA